MILTTVGLGHPRSRPPWQLPKKRQSARTRPNTYKKVTGDGHGLSPHEASHFLPEGGCCRRPRLYFLEKNRRRGWWRTRRRRRGWWRTPAAATAAGPDAANHDYFAPAWSPRPPPPPLTPPPPSLTPSPPLPSPPPPPPASTRRPAPPTTGHHLPPPPM